MAFDLSTTVAAWLGISLAQLGSILLYLVLAAPIISWLRPHVEPALVRWRQAALLTSSSVDDTAVAVLARVWSVLLLVPVVVLRVVPVFTKAVEAARSNGSDDGPPTRPLRKVPRGPLGVLTICILLAGALVTTSGCAGGAPAVHDGLNAATDVVDPAYQAAVIECDLQEGEIIASYPPEEVDAADVALAALRVRCDVAFASFQGVRAAQLAVRAALDAKEDGRATTQDVLRSLDELREAQVTARQFVDAIRAARRGAP